MGKSEDEIRRKQSYKNKNKKQKDPGKRKVHEVKYYLIGKILMKHKLTKK